MQQGQNKMLLLLYFWWQILYKRPHHFYPTTPFQPASATRSFPLSVWQYNACRKTHTSTWLNSHAHTGLHLKDYFKRGVRLWVVEAPFSQSCLKMLWKWKCHIEGLFPKCHRSILKNMMQAEINHKTFVGKLIHKRLKSNTLNQKMLNFLPVLLNSKCFFSQMCIVLYIM